MSVDNLCATLFGRKLPLQGLWRTLKATPTSSRRRDTILFREHHPLMMESNEQNSQTLECIIAAIP